MREWDVPYHVRVLIDKGKLFPFFILNLLSSFETFVLGNGTR